LRYGVCIPQAGRFLDPGVLRRVAGEIEGLGYDSIWVSDHIIVPVGESYIPELMHEPLALLAWLAAETERVTLGISVLVVPYRDPVFTAKFMASVDVLSKGRVVLGVGIGWLEREFEALSASFADRAAVTDEYLRVMRNLWETDTSSFDGRWKHYESMRMFPKGDRARVGTIPIVVGGNQGPAQRRAAELGDGWHPINLTPEQLRDGIAGYRAACAEAGRTPGPVSLRHMPGPDGKILDASDVKAYADAGLDELAYSYPVRTADELLDVLTAAPHS
jgi:probable F420-dependent oxidoreductase